MTYTEISDMLGSIGIPYSYYQFPEGTEQKLPFLCFYYPSNNDFSADNANYSRIDRLVIELYTETKDFALEKTIKETLNKNGIVYAFSESYIDTERMHMSIFESDIVITEV